MGQASVMVLLLELQSTVATCTYFRVFILENERQITELGSIN